MRSAAGRPSKVFGSSCTDLSEPRRGRPRRPRPSIPPATRVTTCLRHRPTRLPRPAAAPPTNYASRPAPLLADTGREADAADQHLQRRLARALVLSQRKSRGQCDHRLPQHPIMTAETVCAARPLWLSSCLGQQLLSHLRRRLPPSLLLLSSCQSPSSAHGGVPSCDGRCAGCPSATTPGGGRLTSQHSNDCVAPLQPDPGGAGEVRQYCHCGAAHKPQVFTSTQTAAPHDARCQH